MKLNTSLKTLPYFAAAGMTYAADQTLKNWVLSHLRLRESLPLLGQSFIELNRTANTGIALGYFGDIGQNDWAIRYLPTAGLFLFLGFAAFRWRSANRLERVGYALFVGAGLSNLVDHWRSWRVVDTLKINLTSHLHLPFNFADVCLISGTALIAYYAFLKSDGSQPGSLSSG